MKVIFYCSFCVLDEEGEERKINEKLLIDKRRERVSESREISLNINEK